MVTMLTAFVVHARTPRCGAPHRRKGAGHRNCVVRLLRDHLLQQKRESLRCGLYGQREREYRKARLPGFEPRTYFQACPRGPLPKASAWFAIGFGLFFSGSSSRLLPGLWRARRDSNPEPTA
jgi:hypothetical protein